MSNQELIQTAVDRLVHDLEVTETFPEGLTARDVSLYISGTYDKFIPTEEILKEIIHNKSLEFYFRLKDAPSE